MIIIIIKNNNNIIIITFIFILRNYILLQTIVSFFPTKLHSIITHFDTYSFIMSFILN